MEPVLDNPHSRPSKRCCQLIDRASKTWGSKGAGDLGVRVGQFRVEQKLIDVERAQERGRVK
jgi:hypothetical protein